MISYNWECQPTVKRLAKSLQHKGYHVWLDIEQMKGSTLEASKIQPQLFLMYSKLFNFIVAVAIEKAELVLICYSQKYIDSPNCRLEGEYTYNRKIPFIPLRVQNGFKPDGW